MIALLEEATVKAAALPQDAQNRLAEILLDALDDWEWDRKFAASQDFLARLADEGIADYESGRTRMLKSAKQGRRQGPFRAATGAGRRP